MHTFELSFGVVLPSPAALEAGGYQQQHWCGYCFCSFYATCLRWVNKLIIKVKHLILYIIGGRRLAGGDEE